MQEQLNQQSEIIEFMKTITPEDLKQSEILQEFMQLYFPKEKMEAVQNN